MPTKTKSDAASTASTPALISPASTAVPLRVTFKNLAHAPERPVDFKPFTKAQRASFHRLTAGQTANLGAVATELESSTTFARDFAHSGMGQGQLVELLRTGNALHRERGRARAWLQFIRDQRAGTLDTIGSTLQNLGAELQVVLKTSPELAETYPLLVTMLAAKSEIGARGAAKRVAANAQAKADKAAQQAADKAAQRAARAAIKRVKGTVGANSPPPALGDAKLTGTDGK
jgi:hypothetical protein